MSMKEKRLDYAKSREELQTFFTKFSVDDIATSLFVSSLWLPNLSSQIKHKFYYTVFCSQESEVYKSEDQLNNYKKFEKFLRHVYSHSPSFYELEDYIPELDWGDVYYHMAHQNFKIFYGCEVENVYDYYNLFELIHFPIHKEYINVIGRDPKKDFYGLLSIQDRVIGDIDTQSLGLNPDEINPGDLSIPSKEFWEEARDSFRELDITDYFQSKTIESLSIEIGNPTHKELNEEQFIKSCMEGESNPSQFVRNGEKYYLKSPREVFPVVFESWGKEFIAHFNDLNVAHEEYKLRLTTELIKYARRRLSKKNLFPLVSIISDGKFRETTYPLVIYEDGKLLFVYLLNPHPKVKDYEDELESISAQIQEDIEIMSKPPHQLALHLDQSAIQFDEAKGKTIRIEVFTLLPQTFLAPAKISLPSNYPGQLIFMDQFLGLIDEVESASELFRFMEFLREHDKLMTGPFQSLLDNLDSFRALSGVIVEGAEEPTMIILDPHSGSNYRYESLRKFWSLYPTVQYYGHPRRWNLTQETKTRVRMESKSREDVAIWFKIHETTIFINFPLSEMSIEQLKISNFLLECIEDTFSRSHKVISDHPFFNSFEQLSISIFPSSLVESNPKLKHLLQLVPKEKNWLMNCGYLKPGVPGIRIVYDDERVNEAFINVSDRSLEIDLTIDVLNRINEFVRYEGIQKIINSLSAHKIEKPRFKLTLLSSEISFPELLPVIEPEVFQLKSIDRRIAKICQSNGFKPGTYKIGDAIQCLNQIRDSLLADLDSLINTFNFNQSVPQIITNFESLAHSDYIDSEGIKSGFDRDIDYDPSIRYSKSKAEYRRQSSNNIFLIEKFVQLMPVGDAVLEKEEIGHLLGLADRLLMIYNISDGLVYGVNPVGMTIKSDYRLEINYPEEHYEKLDTFWKEYAEISLGQRSIEADRVTSPRPAEEFLTTLNDAFISDAGFSIKGMYNVLTILSQWTGYQEKVQNSPYYSAPLSKIESVCAEKIIGIDTGEIQPIVEFLTLRTSDITKIIDTDVSSGEFVECNELPVWEHKKRFMRYAIRPLIQVGDQIYWGPYSAYQSANRWAIHQGSTLPVSLPLNRVNGVIDEEKSLIEGELEKKTEEILLRYSNHVERRLDLSKRDKKAGYPRALGDFDVLAHIPEKNVVLNVECNDRVPAYVLKDAKTSIEKLFGKPGGKRGKISKVEKRQEFLEANMEKIASTLGWDLGVKEINIIPVLISRQLFWWTRFPPVETKVRFERIDCLGELIESL